MKLHTYQTIKESKPNILEGIPLHDQYCGLFRCPISEARKILPCFEDLFLEAIDMLKNQGHNPVDWEMDMKIHMLMKDQYPCIPNWHCDNVPRVDGKTKYSLIEKGTPSMYLWLSDNPTTEFLSTDWNCKNFTPKGHDTIAKHINSQRCQGLQTEKVPSKTWISMDQQTPHRGTQAQENTWRVFIRLTHKSITPVRPVNSYIRRHCQVYLNPETFSW